MPEVAIINDREDDGSVPVRDDLAEVVREARARRLAALARLVWVKAGG